MNAEEAAKAQGGAAKSGANGWWNCKCPAHDDHTASLDLKDAEDGRIIYKCQAGCDKKAVAAALLAMDLLPKREPTKKKKRGPLTHTYRYEDETGALVFEVCRYANPKSFAQRRPDPDAPDGWAWNLTGIGLRPLYRLPQLITADPDEFIYICEGEKDADRLASLGLIATTPAQGAGKWSSTDSSVLAGRHVVILPDADLPGRRHAVAIMHDLDGKAASVRALDLDDLVEGLPSKGDVSDWLDQGHTVQELRELADMVPPFSDGGDGWDFIGQANGEGGTSKPNGEAHGVGARGGARAWWGRLLYSKTGARDCLANVATVLRLDSAFVGQIFYDEMRERAVLGSMPWQPTNRLRDAIDADHLKLAEWLQKKDLPAIKPTTAAGGLQIVASENRINPLRDRLDALEWDKVKRLDSWLTDYLGVENTPYSATVGRKWMIGAVARVYRPGCKVDNLLILEGDQDLNKSNVCETLALEQEWLTDDISDIGKKDCKEDLAGKWIIEIAELAAMRRSEVEKVKAFFTRRVDHYRPSYGRLSQDFPRRCTFIGTTNSTNYLVDPTGNRRYWPVRVGAIAIDALRLDVGQIWAEATAAFKASEQWWLADGEKPGAAEAQEERRLIDPWEGPVLTWARDVHDTGECIVADAQGYKSRIDTTVTTANALLYAVRLELPKQDRTAEMRVGAILRAAGWQRKRRRGDDGDRSYVYEPPALPASPVPTVNE